MTTRLRANIILSPDNASWIIEKMAERLAEHAPAFGVDARIGSAPDPTADINHWMSYAFANQPRVSPTTMTITHLDDPYKIGMVAGLLRNGNVDLGIGLSSAHMEFLARNGVPESGLAHVVPGHDFAAAPRRIVIGITTRVYKDGRKREAMLVKLAQSMRLDAFRFDIFGAGWEPTIETLRAAGGEVRHYPGTADYVADYQEIMAAIPHFDYYLYLGRDEGSLGTLDALAAGVRTIITPQGFHCDLPNGITHPVWDQKDLEGVFRSIALERSHLIDSVAHLTWAAYARDHCHLWKAIAAGTKPNLTSTRAGAAGTAARDEAKLHLRLRYFSPRRVRSALSHIPLLKPVRRWLLKR